MSAGTYIRNFALSLDCFLNAAVLRGKPGETISIHAAYAKQQGERWGCILCLWLSWTIERNHCALALAGLETKTTAGLLALLQLLTVAVSLFYSPSILRWCWLHSFTWLTA